MLPLICLLPGRRSEVVLFGWPSRPAKTPSHPIIGWNINIAVNVIFVVALCFWNYLWDAVSKTYEKDIFVGRQSLYPWWWDQVTRHNPFNIIFLQLLPATEKSKANTLSQVAPPQG